LRNENIRLQKCPYFGVIVGPERSNDPENKAGGSIATDKVTQAGPVNDDDPDKKGHHGHPGWGLDLGVTNPPRKKELCSKTLRDASDGFHK